MNLLDFIPKKDDPIAKIRVGQKDIHRIPLDPEGTTQKFTLGAGIENFDEAKQKLVPRHDFTHPDAQNGIPVFVGIPHAINAGNGGDDDDVAPTRHQR